MNKQNLIGHTPKIKFPILADQIKSFQSTIYNYYHLYGRDLPWRRTHNPYHILVSEIMLQQTQVQRVLTKYNDFIKTFPDFCALAGTPFNEILPLWQGLGYNRRALSLHKIAKEICYNYNGNLPQQKSVLLTLPSIGKATAASLLAFAFNIPQVIIETNIRAVFIFFFFKKQNKVKDSEMYPYIECTMDTSNLREWYYALMDYGVFLKKKYPSLTNQSAQYKKQSPFIGSDRQIRGMILKIITDNYQVTEQDLYKMINKDKERVLKIFHVLIKEGFVEKKGKYYFLKQ